MRPGGRPRRGGSDRRPDRRGPGPRPTAWIFISYSRADLAYVEGLAGHLSAHGVRVWYDDSVQAGDAIAPTIQTAIDQCAALVPVLTPTAVASKWVNREIAHADEQDIPLLPLLLGPCRKPLALAGLRIENVVAGALPSAGFVDRLRALSLKGSRRSVGGWQSPGHHETLT